MIAFIYGWCAAVVTVACGAAVVSGVVAGNPLIVVLGLAAVPLAVVIWQGFAEESGMSRHISDQRRQLRESEARWRAR